MARRCSMVSTRRYRKGSGGDHRRQLGQNHLLRSINLLEQPEAAPIRVGDVTIDAGRSLGPQKGLIRQLRQRRLCLPELCLFPHRTVLENEGPVIGKVR